MNEIRRVGFPLSVLPFPAAYERLTASACQAFFPADVVREGQLVQIFYHTEGYLRLRDLQNLSQAEILQIIKELLKTLDVCRDWLWFPEEFVLSVDTVYIGSEGQVRLMYIPMKKNASAVTQLSCLLCSMKSLTDSQGCLCLETCISLLTEENLRTRQILAVLDHLAAQIQTSSER